MFNLAHNGGNLPIAHRLTCPAPLYCREDRYAYIRAKYVERRFVVRSTSDPYELLQDTELAVSTRHLYQLLQAQAEGADLTSPITGSQLRETALHLAVRQVRPVAVRGERVYGRRVRLVALRGGEGVRQKG